MTDTVWIVWAEDTPSNTPVLGAFETFEEADAYAADIDAQHAGGALVTPLKLPFAMG